MFDGGIGSSPPTVAMETKTISINASDLWIQKVIHTHCIYILGYNVKHDEVDKFWE